MPYVNIKVTREGGPDGTGPSAAQKKELIVGVTDLLTRILDKDPATTFVIIDEVDLDNWGLNRMSTRDYRAQQSG